MVGYSLIVGMNLQKAKWGRMIDIYAAHEVVMDEQYMVGIAIHVLMHILR